MKKFWFEGDRRTFTYALLKSWHKILKVYEENIRDLPYYYIEPTNIGFLSLAAYRIGAISIEEYSTFRGKGAKRYSGRADLWIQSKGGITHDIEGKKDWIALNSKNVATKINSLLKKSKDNINNLSEKSNCSIALVFLIPYFSKDKESDLRPFIKQMLNIKSHNGDFAAVHFCDEQIWREMEVKGKFYPGIAVVGKYV